MMTAHFVLMFISAAVVNMIIYYIFSKFLIRRENAAMKFIMLTLIKDVIWAVTWLLILDRSRTTFLMITGIFVCTSFFLYYKVIRQLNRS